MITRATAEGDEVKGAFQMTCQSRTEGCLACTWGSMEEVAASIWDTTVCVDLLGLRGEVW